jgi:hypothetical protein
MEHLQLEPGIRDRLLEMSAATIDRALREAREKAGGRRRRRATPSALRQSIPVRTFFDWNDPPPGFFEADFVAHSGPRSSGSFIQTLVLTDIATGWTEFLPLLVRDKNLLTEALTSLRTRLPFAMLGLDTDNDSCQSAFNFSTSKAPRGRRRPDPLVAVTEQIQSWFAAEPWRTASEFLQRLKKEYPNVCDDRHLRTLQRRLKTMRRDSALNMILVEADPGASIKGELKQAVHQAVLDSNFRE